MVYKNSDEEVRRGGGTPREVKKGQRRGRGGREGEREGGRKEGREGRGEGCEMDNTMVLLSWKGRVVEIGLIEWRAGLIALFLV